jgi:three-Cys-motif partner protein
MDEAYEGREQSAAKHLILERYLEKLAYKVSLYRRDRRRLTLNYIDGFAGPWGHRAADLSDTSPYLALKSLVTVRDAVASKGHDVSVRAFFVSLDEDGARLLHSVGAQYEGVETRVATGTFEENIAAASRFAGEGVSPFSFIFIDPTGWTGFGLRAIEGLLRTGRNEVLINFMTGHVSRLIARSDAQEMRSFVDLYGNAYFLDAWRGLQGLDREDQIVATYCDRVRLAGGYRHCVSGAILNPQRDRTHFHLVYGTRSDAGLVTFRDIERQGLAFQRTTRAEAQRRAEEARTGQGTLFGASALVVDTYEDELQRRYRARAQAVLDSFAARAGNASWDDVVIAALQVPMTCEADVTEWVRARQREGMLEFVLNAGGKLPKWGRSDRIRWLK